MIIKIEGSDAFLDDETYHRLTAALAAVQPDPHSDKIEAWQFVEVLGEIGGIWPAETLTDPAREVAAKHTYARPLSSYDLSITTKWRGLTSRKDRATINTCRSNPHKCPMGGECDICLRKLLQRSQPKNSPRVRKSSR